MGNLLSKKDESRLSFLVRNHESKPGEGSPGVSGIPTLYLAVHDAVIPGRDGTTCSTAECQIYQVADDASDDDKRKFEALGTDKQVVVNVLRGDVPADRMMFLGRDSSGEFIVLGWDCEG